MTSCHLIADRELTLLGYVYTYALVYTVLEVAVCLLCRNNNVNDYAGTAVRNSLGGILNVSCLLTEDRLVETLFSSLVRLTLR